MVNKVIVGGVALTLSSIACVIIAADQGMKRKKDSKIFKEEIKKRDIKSKNIEGAFKKLYEQNIVLANELKKYKNKDIKLAY